MPIFEYVCNDCQNQFEELVSGDQKVACPECSSVKITKKLSTFAAAVGSSPAQPPCGQPSCPSGFT